MKKTFYLSTILSLIVLLLASCDNFLDEPNKPNEKPNVIPEEIVFYKDFKDGIGDFTIQNIIGKETWQHDQVLNAIKMSGNVNDVDYENEDWLISPEINLTGYVNVSLNFNYTARYFENIEEEATIWITEKKDDGTITNWTQLTSVSLASDPILRFNRSGSIDLSKFLNKKVCIAFKYKSSENSAGEWHIKDIEVKQSKVVNKIIYEETFANSLGKFNAIDVKGDQAWEYNKNEYAIMTGYVNPNRFENEDWLISPEIDLTEETEILLRFDHVVRYFDNVNRDATIWISTNYKEGMPSAASWTQIETDFVNKTDWDFISAKYSLVEYAGKKIRIAFKYTSTNGDAGTWEIKNFKVTREDDGDTEENGNENNEDDPDFDSNAIFHETFGTGTHGSDNRPKIGNFTGFSMKSPIAYADQSGSVDIRSTGAFNAHAWFPGKKNAYLTITGIDLSKYKNISLSYNLVPNIYNPGETMNINTMQVKANDTALSVPNELITEKDKVTTITIDDIPDTTTKIEFFSSSENNTLGWRLDNIKIVGDKK